MHTLVVGPGALGSLLISQLGRTDTENNRYTLIDHNSERAAELTARGIHYSFHDEEAVITVEASSNPKQVDRADVIILCVKSYDIEDCLKFCGPLLTEKTLLIFMQNGIAHLDVQHLTGKAAAAYGTTTEGANLLGPGKVKHAGKGLTQLGFLQESSPQAAQALEKVAQLFNQAGLATKIRDDILSRLWTKLLVNTGINGLTATLDCTNGELLTLPGVQDRMTILVHEAMAVARASAIPVPEDALEITKGVCAKTHANISSMLQDVRAGRRTEIEAINGAVIKTAKKFNIATPQNIRLVEEVRKIEQTFVSS
ncbi:ketopantoate reductase family protein [Desulfopila sp. IMCC35008]|uniref:ketopantoate reductase family protein n=1 Tax=Desulfopila sp. IMCC35008 TaxID=2653858 RepID=UPI0013D34AEB|nr:2-dehydropantoate 2-reductase [Desulfopila sp. IMCC35008]